MNKSSVFPSRLRRSRAKRVLVPHTHTRRSNRRVYAFQPVFTRSPREAFADKVETLTQRGSSMGRPLQTVWIRVVLTIDLLRVRLVVCLSPLGCRNIPY